MISSYRDLKIWQDAMTLAEDCYRITKGFPKDEMYGMTAQIRRSATSVAANVAEGYGRDSTRSYVNFLRIAQGSLKELETHLILSERVGLASAGAVAAPLENADAIGRMLRSLIRNLDTRVQPQ